MIGDNFKNPIIKFEYTDELGHNTNMTIELDYNQDWQSPFDLMLQSYAKFLIACGYPTQLVKDELYEDL